MPYLTVAVGNIMADALFGRPRPSLTVRELPGFSERVSLQAPASEVAQLFASLPDLVGAIVIDESAKDCRRCLSSSARLPATAEPSYVRAISHDNLPSRRP